MRKARAWARSADRHRAMQLTGPTGVGKHVIARLLVEEFPSLHIIEHNGDDQLPTLTASSVVVGGADLKSALKIRIEPVPEILLFYWLQKRGYAEDQARRASRIARGDVRRALTELILPDTIADRQRQAHELDMDTFFWNHIPLVASLDQRLVYNEFISAMDAGAGELGEDWHLPNLPRHCPKGLVRRKKRATPQFAPTDIHARAMPKRHCSRHRHQNDEDS